MHITQGERGGAAGVTNNKLSAFSLSLSHTPQPVISPVHLLHKASLKNFLINLTHTTQFGVDPFMTLFANIRMERGNGFCFGGKLVVKKGGRLMGN